MSLHLITRVAAVAAVAASSAAFVAADLKGDYNIELVVEGTTYTGTTEDDVRSQGRVHRQDGVHVAVLHSR